MAGIEISQGMPVPEETICGPVSDFQGLTLSENCIAMGQYGAIAGFLAFALLLVGYFWAGPRVYAYGKTRLWW